MPDRAVQWVVVALLALIVGVPFLLRPSVPDAGADGGASARLIVITPHNEQIRYEFARAFNARRAAEGKPAVAFDWRASGGTSDLRKNVISQFEGLAARGEETRGIGIDLFWGGGDFEHNQLALGPSVRLHPADEDGSGLRYAFDRVLVRDAAITLRWAFAAAPPMGAEDARPTVSVRLSDPEGRVELRPATGAPSEATVGGVVVSAQVRVSAADLSVAILEVRIRNEGERAATLGGVACSPESISGFVSSAGMATLSFPVTVPADVPDEALFDAFPEPTIGGEPLYHPDRYWIGVVLSSFGIVYNNDLLEMLNAPRPDTWRDLAAPQYRGWVALADPGHSGSIAQTYNVILRRTGWHEGWELLREVFANARYFTSSAAKVPVDVSAGETAAGMCIDFYGRFQAGAVAGEDPGTEPRVGYADPPFMTATTADPISVLRGAPSEELANEFIRFLLTVEAQRLWQRRLGEVDGPARFELRRLPIRRDLYTAAEARSWADPEADPWSYTKPIPPATPNYYGLVGPLTHAMAVDVHDDLARAWRTILETPPDHPNLARMLAIFHAMPEDLTLQWPSPELYAEWQAILEDPGDPRHGEVVATLRSFSADLARITSDADLLLARRLEWTLFFRANYRRVVELAAE